MISIISVNWHSEDWASILSESLQIYTKVPYELLIVDNNDNNIGHGAGINKGIQAVSYDYTAVFDIDCHVLQHGWEEAFLNLMADYDFVAPRGVAAKPIRPCCMFMKTTIAKQYDWQATPGYQGHRLTPQGYDTAIKAYHQMTANHVPLFLMESSKNRYETLNGEEWCINGIPLVYHHWHGSHLQERQIDFPKSDLMTDKELLFSRIPWRIFQLF